MRVLIDIPLDANTDLDKIYQVIAQVNQSGTRQTPRSVDRSYDFRPTDRKKWSLFLPYCDDCANGTQTTVYHTYYKLYHDALMEAGISLPTGKERDHVIRKAQKLECRQGPLRNFP